MRESVSLLAHGVSREIAHAILLGSAVAVCAVPAPLPAQRRPALPPAPVCDGKTISDVEIVREEPALIGSSAPRWTRPMLRTILRHTLTRDVAIEPFLLVEPGMTCSEFRLAESARVLRAQPYLARATVTSAPDAAGGVRVRVETVDEIPLVIGGGIRDGRLSALKYGNANVRGTGMYAAAAWREGFAYRDGMALRFQQHHVLGHPVRVGANVERTPLGRDLSFDASRPFYTRFQHVGWYAGVRDAAGYAPFQRPDAARLSLEYDRIRSDAGAIFRFGGGSALFFAGPFLTHQRFRPFGEGVVIADTGLAVDPDTELDDRYESISSTRIAGVLGARWLSHVEALGFDALMGPQDVARGVQATVALGRSVAGDRRGNVAAGHLFAGVGGATNFIGLSALTEGQQRNGEWDDAVVSGRLAWYAKPSDRQTRIIGAEYSGAWSASEPYQLALGDRQGGLRGYGDSRAVGARRAVLRAEQRWVIGGVSSWFAFGAAAFGDVGKTWAGDVPFGVTTGTRTSLGVSVLASVPRQSRRLLRVDFAVPLVDDPHAGFEIRVSTSRSPREFWREPNDIARLRAVLPPAGVFGWP
jgi:hypothetical protein